MCFLHLLASETTSKVNLKNADERLKNQLITTLKTVANCSLQGNLYQVEVVRGLQKNYESIVIWYLQLNGILHYNIGR